MNVFFNFELDDESDVDLSDPLILTYFDSLRDFVKSRLKVLQEEINEEEINLPVKMTVLYIGSQKNDRQGIEFTGYSSELLKKMADCVNIDDIKYLHNKHNLFT